MNNGNARHFNNVISVNFFGNAFYHPGMVSFDMKVHSLQLSNHSYNRETGLYFTSLLNHCFDGRYSYGNQLSSSKLKKENFQLDIPMYKDGTIAFDYIEAYIKELEAERIKELEAYLVATGLNDYVLTDEEEKVLADFKNRNSMWGEFSIGELFKVTTSKKRFDANKVIIQEKGYPYIARTSLNNGVRGYIKEDTKYLNEANTISFGQDTATMFYQKEQYFTGDKIKILTPEFDGFDEIIAQFFITSMYKSFSTFTWGSSSYNMKIINSQKIRIFVYPDGQPDYERMHVFIRALEKIVIKGVVEWKDKQIQATKDVVDSE